MDLRNWEFYTTGQALVGASVSLYVASVTVPNPNSPLQTTTTDSNGMWSFANLADGDYDVKVTYNTKSKWYMGLVRFGVSTLRTGSFSSVLHNGNSLKDGGFEQWPRGASVAVAASTDLTTQNGYGPACWSIKTGANQACHWTQVTGLNDASQFAAAVGRDAGQTGTTTLIAEEAYRLSSIIPHRNQKIGVVFTAKAGANWSPASGNLTVRLACGTGGAARRGGSAYTGETALIVQTIPLATTKTTYNYVSSVVVPTTATQMSLSFEWTPVGTAGADDTFTVDDVMVTAGDVARSYLPRPDDTAECLREVVTMGGSTFSPVGAGATTANNTARIHVALPTQMQGAPNLKASGNWACGGAALSAINTPVLNVASNTTVELTVTATAGTPWTALNLGGIIMLANNDATARLIFSTEIL